jgi:hypothetical protein
MNIKVYKNKKYKIIIEDKIIKRTLELSVVLKIKFSLKNA